MLKVGDKIPKTITVKDLNNINVKLEDFLDSLVVLYFYPTDDTPGCTEQACSFRDFNFDIQKLGVKIIGVSNDSIESHIKFKKKYNLNFDLWSDENHKLIEAFGSWQPKKLFGKEFMGTLRSTFVINKDGTIIATWEKANSATNAQEVYEFLKTIVK